jgi:DNA-binding NtrC family response regulator
LFEAHIDDSLVVVRHDTELDEAAVFWREADETPTMDHRSWQRLPRVCRMNGGFLLASAPRPKALERRIDALARTPLHVLFRGDTGVGKEIWARRLHAASGREGEFVALNCAALPKDLLLSELFGHAQGAFSGATHARQGLFRAAHLGTLLLDEIAELPLAQQATLLRVLEDKLVRPVGSDRAYPVDVRVIAATNVPLEARVRAGEFRADLLARIAETTVTIPALRQRPHELLPLARDLARDEGADLWISFDAIAPLLNHSWPMNVRELRSLVRLHAALAGGAPLTRHFLRENKPELFVPVEPLCEEEPEPARSPMPSYRERMNSRIQRLEAALTDSRGNVAEAATRLGLSRATLYREIRRHGIDVEPFRNAPSRSGTHVACAREFASDGEAAPVSRSA